MTYKIGDIVRVYKPEGIIPEPGWPSSMDKFMDKPQRIQSITKKGHYKLENGDDYVWKEEWFEDPMLTLINEVTK